MKTLSLRTRLALLYGGMFLLAGMILLLVDWLLVSRSLPDAATFARKIDSAGVSAGGDTTILKPGPDQLPPGTKTIVATSIGGYRDSALSTLMVWSAVGLLITGAFAVLFGWLAAGRVLRPLHKVTSTARQIEAGKLDQRIDLDGPPGDLKELADTFDAMLDRLASSFDSQRRFVANASHELRTPLAVQRTLVEVAMTDPEVSPDLHRLGRQLLLTNERSERMIEGLLVLARSDRGLSGTAPVRLDRIVDTVLLAMSDLATQHDVLLRAVTTPRVVIGDQVLLERLVTNLVHNAVHYNKPGGLVRVTVGADPALIVVNTGPPVPGEAVPGLFEPFRRLVGERTANARGAGLGLSIVRSIANAHGGAVAAVPGPAGGLRVEVRLPVTAEPVADARALTAAPV
ncbi:ATP-binding protein [Labedaea rhizosphaerae]|uniref:histidine kinase n=1 Tax=Labedaea rhizosphaerae TaxID=598644 RepID=A0A4R6SC19_LABRH|nr:ATP-binding protein [Labedaea rhizosphaerae]TDP97512.1 signal transduction histidine kinase [Labedaea rhizosphaerae]